MKQSALLLKILLWLIALHSCIVGILLISLGNEGMQFLGFAGRIPFFQIQGGIFLLVMCIAYLMASYDVITNRRLVIFIILAKCMMAVFLLSYYSFVKEIDIVLYTGIADGIMATALLILYLQLPWKKSNID